MADVSTWTDFVAQLGIANNEINLTADIDANNYPVSSPIVIATNVTVNGNDHAIYNLQAGSSNINGIFEAATTPTFNNVKFLNIFCTIPTGVFYSSGIEAYLFRDCEFQGAGNLLFRRVAAYRCSVAWQVIGAGELVESPNATFQDCYLNVKKTYKGNDTASMFSGLSTVVDMSGCLLEGEGYNETGSTVPMFRSTGISTSNVINVETTGDFSIPAMNTTNISIINTSVMETPPAAVNGVAQVNADQFRDVDYLQSIGFSIIDI